MAVQICPLCGSRVEIPRAEIRKRYFCKKCHSPFHLNKAGIAVVGDPPDIDVELAETKQKLNELLERIPAKNIGIGVAAIVLLLIIGYFVFGPGERLDQAGQKAARALAENNLSYFKSIAAPGTDDDVIRWFEASHLRLVQARQRWLGGKEEVAESHVGQEDRSRRKGSVMLSIHRVVGTGIDLSLANPAAATASADAPFDVETDWTLSRWGRWQLDGHATYAKVQR